MLGAGTVRCSGRLPLSPLVAAAPRRTFSRLTVPTVPVSDLASQQELIAMGADDTVAEALDVMRGAGQDVVAVNASRPSSETAETIGVLSENSLMMKVRAQHPAVGPVTRMLLTMAPLLRNQLGQLGEWNRGRSLERTLVSEVMSPISSTVATTSHTAKECLIKMLDSADAECEPRESARPCPRSLCFPNRALSRPLLAVAAASTSPS